MTDEEIEPKCANCRAWQPLNRDRDQEWGDCAELTQTRTHTMRRHVCAKHSFTIGDRAKRRESDG